VLFALLGLVVLAVIHNPAPASWRPALPPLVVCGLGVAILIGRVVRASAPPPRPLERVLLVGVGRRIDWPVRAPSILDVRAVAGGVDHHDPGRLHRPRRTDGDHRGILEGRMARRLGEPKHIQLGRSVHRIIRWCGVTTGTR
jgi:hypothetical protein